MPNPNHSVTCPACDGEGRFAWPEPTAPACELCEGSGELTAWHLTTLPLPVLVDGLLSGSIDEEAFAAAVLHQARVRLDDPTGLYPRAWARVPSDLRIRIDSLIDLHFEPARAAE